MQPLDIGLFGLLQHYYGLALDEFTRVDQHGIGREDFEPFLYKAQERAYTIKNIKIAWKKAGLVPYNFEAVHSCISRSNPVQKEIFLLDKIPTTTAQVQSLAHHGRQLVALSSDSTKLGKVVDLLEHMALVQSANAAVKVLEAAQVKKKLGKKKG